MTATSTSTPVPVVIYGPNVPFADGVTFHVHRQGCADLHHRPYRHITAGSDQGGYGTTASSVLEIVQDIYPPGDFDYDLDDEAEADAYVSDVHVFPCTGLTA